MSFNLFGEYSFLFEYLRYKESCPFKEIYTNSGELMFIILY